MKGISICAFWLAKGLYPTAKNQEHMMDEIQVTARLAIHDGKFENFKDVARTCLVSVREKDTGTLQYDWFLNEDQAVCTVRERYQDSDAVLQHVANLGDTLGELLAVSVLSLEVYGAPSSELLNALEGMDVSVHSFLQGTSSP
jgi:quinol monooxygenase YgiN